MALVQIDRDGACLTLTLDDPASRNALSPEMVAALGAAVTDAAADPSLQLIVLRGANQSFCVGANLKGIGGSAPIGFDEAYGFSREGAAIFGVIANLPVAVVAVIDGPAFAGGLGLACCADIVLCGPDAKFALSETAVGLVPAQIAPYVVGRIGLPATRRLCLSAAIFGSAEALAIGLADEVHDSAEALEVAVARTVKAIRRCAPGANAATKKLLLTLGNAHGADYIDEAARIFAAAVTGDEGREGIAAFIEKRKPRWAGER